MTPNFRDLIHADRPAVGMWIASGDAVCAEICAGSGLDWLIIDGEHAPNDLRSILAQLQAISAYPIAPVVRPPIGDPVLIKQLLDIGVQNLLIPMVHSREQAESVVRAVRYPPRGIRGVGSALARSSRWNRIRGYTAGADAAMTTVVQIESTAALDALEEIVSVDGIDGVFIGPADLAASMGHLGEQSHPDVIAAVEDAIGRVAALGKPVGVNAFEEKLAKRYLAAGVRFILVGSDVTLLARGSEDLASRFG
jgi:4-hydroxy-2-oxoheptanedioate aldolase